LPAVLFSPVLRADDGSVLISCDVRLVTLTDATLERLGVDFEPKLKVGSCLDNEQVPPFCAWLQGQKELSILQTPRLTLCNGQEGTMQLGNLSVTLRPTTRDGKTFRIRLAASWPEREVNFDRTLSIPQGQTAYILAGTRLVTGRNEYGPPVLSKIPYVNRLVKNVGYGRQMEHVAVLLTPHMDQRPVSMRGGEEVSEQSETHGAGKQPGPGGARQNVRE
jgi:hypothetical protein